MALDQNKEKPHDILSYLLKEELKAVNQLIHERMTSEYAPRIPEIASHLIDAGGKKLRPLLTLATAKAGQWIRKIYCRLKSCGALPAI